MCVCVWRQNFLCHFSSPFPCTETYTHTHTNTHRIVIFLVKATLPYNLLWVEPLCDEGATLLFYCISGWKFRPADANPYLAVNNRDVDPAELEEFGLEDEYDDDDFDVRILDMHTHT